MLYHYNNEYGGEKMAQTIITFRIDEDMKEELNGICEALGLTLSGALTIFAKK